LSRPESSRAHTVRASTIDADPQAEGMDTELVLQAQRGDEEAFATTIVEGITFM
jgi:hypothetical protein